jgi:ankyrin repeat protein
MNKGILLLVLAALLVVLGLYTTPRGDGEHAPVHGTRASPEITLSEFRQFCRDGNVAEVEKALRAGFDVNARDVGGGTALMESIMHHEVCQVLIRHGIDVNAQREMQLDGFTALHMACIVSASPEVVTLMLEAGANPDVADQFGKKPIDYARENRHHQGFAERVRLLESCVAR